ncbi:lysine-specific permease [Bifidobacterium saguini DSM 23967]|uniref:Amino acid permease n=3 Tax=Bifidobacterium TaxID=1678 RepID=A0A2N5ISX0_9BIFI|nr:MULTISPECIES: amino acid permease [Bifidobacterium]KFI92693.1 lysine-specific permease [Bifidobacterium saguini DSM 23967]PLS25041.1 amino acid transporter [Bifidobacterium imperatoris]QSY58671.1 amino acid permease [Bifidobacterium imperatoris]QTB91702.1 amino acid permease [Bifidobacterium saguini]
MSQPETDQAAQSPSTVNDGTSNADTAGTEPSHIGKEHTKHALHTNLKRGMESRHLQMISLGGVIGTGLFLSSGYTIQQAGPMGTILAYAIGAVIVYLVMLTLGELSVAMPVTGSFHVYAEKFIGPGTGFVIAIQYWLTWTVALGSEFTAAGLLMQRWFPDTPTWAWSAACIVLIFTLNALSVRFFAEAEFWFASIKVFAICAFIAIGLLAIFGIIPMKGYSHAPMFGNLVKDGIFPNGFMPVFATILTVNFAFSGTELIGVTAGETRDPETAVPKAIHTTLWRLVLFFIGSIVVMCALIPWREAGVGESPFVLVFSSIGIPYAADIMNFVVLTAVLSASNSGLYASTRMVWSMGHEGMIPHWFAKTNRHGVPVLALCTAMAGGLLALLSSVVAASTVYLVLVALSGLSAVVVWIAIAYCQIVFRKRWIASGHTAEELKYRTPGYPWTSWGAFILCTASFLLVFFDKEQRFALGAELAFLALCYAAYFVQQWWRKKHPREEDEPLQLP